MRMKIMKIAIVGTFVSLMLLGQGNVSGAAEPYVIGYLTDITGDARHNYAPDSEGFRVYMDMVNARGVLMATLLR